MKTYHAALTIKSRNEKTGPIPVSTTSHVTCPSACPLAANGCYAESGPLAIFWKSVTEKKFGDAWRAFCKNVAAMPAGVFWRHNQAGDLPGDRVNLDTAALALLVDANQGKQGFTYTHYDVIKNRANRAAVKAANARGFTVNLSANNLPHADLLLATKAGPVVTILAIEAKPTDAPLFTPKGARVIICPATYRDDISCGGGMVGSGKTRRMTKACQLCARDRKTVVGFPAHGQSKRKAEAIASASKS